MRLPAVLDRAVDWIPPVSYGRLGLAMRAARFAPLPSLAGKTCVVTGGTAGIGRATAVALAALGADVIVIGRDRERGRAAVGDLDAVGGRGRFEPCDVGRLDEVAALVERLPARLDVIVHGAGALVDRRRLTPDGIEETWATHVLGPFALTARALPRLRAAGAPRVVFVSSGGMYLGRLELDAWRGADPFDGVRAYAVAKRAQVELVGALTARVSDVAFFAMHPGWVDTAGVRTALPRFHRVTRRILRTPAEGADTIAFLAAAPASALVPGGFYLDRRPRPTHRVWWTRPRAGEREALVRQLVDQCGVDLA